MTKEDQREIQRKLRVLEHAERTGQVSKTCRYFGIGWASFYRWKRAFERDGEDGLANAKPIPKNIAQPDIAGGRRQGPPPKAHISSRL